MKVNIFVHNFMECKWDPTDQRLAYIQSFYIIQIINSCKMATNILSISEVRISSKKKISEVRIFFACKINFPTTTYKMVAINGSSWGFKYYTRIRTETFIVIFFKLALNLIHLLLKVFLASFHFFFV